MGACVPSAGMIRNLEGGGDVDGDGDGDGAGEGGAVVAVAVPSGFGETEGMHL
eukprot:CAMPEP_0172387526 /NCGR_PEP_ID=MMETSP1061-20121228/4823_1 /TAXON_ID=37318 /ORGANISM="Pseudo-nitzschia pungens, Strain cf. pungens" /LENGTH=52 /DNA_ID=CAMNT_0013117181 /DNA_START=256 /DNA_END=414 /DNA_ORIENTATION=+